MGMLSKRIIGYLFRCRGAGLKRAAYWREQGFPNLVLARAAMAKIRAERRQQEAGRRFSPFAIPGEPYEDLLPPKPRRRRRKQVYKSRVLGRSRNTDQSAPRGRYRPKHRQRWKCPES